MKFQIYFYGVVTIEEIYNEFFLWNFYQFFYKAILHVAAENGNAEIVKLLLSKENLDVNCISILNYNFSYNFNSFVFHLISNYLFSNKISNNHFLIKSF